MKTGLKEKTKKTSIKFVEWCVSYGLAKYGDKWISGALWDFGHQKAYTLEEIFDKFIEEKQIPLE